MGNHYRTILWSREEGWTICRGDTKSGMGIEIERMRDMTTPRMLDMMIVMIEIVSNSTIKDRSIVTENSDLRAL